MTDLTSVLSIGGWVVAGVFAIVGAFSKARRDRRKEDEDLSNNLIKNLQLSVNQQKEMIDDLTKTVEQNQKEIHTLQGRNQQLTDILQGRDPDQAKVFKEAPLIFDIAKENNAISKANNAALMSLTKTIEEFLRNLSKLSTANRKRGKEEVL